jgi:hypothetical protein
MYPRNAASPERISIGAVVQISDGAVQTSGVTVKVIPFGGTEASGGGTVAYSADGIVLYTPTQAETNYTSFIVAAVKSGCIPASVTIVTTASSTAGKSVVASIDNDVITAASIASDAITDAKVASDVTIASVTGAVGSVAGNVGGSVASVVGAVGSVTGNVGGNVTGSVASVANYGSLVADVATAVWGAGTRSLTTFGTLASDVWAVATRTLTAASDSSGITTLLSRILGTLAAGTHNAQSGDSFARLGAPNAASIAADIAAEAVKTAAILVDTNELQTDWANGGRLDVILDAASAPSAAVVAAAVWDEVLSGHLTAGSTGNALNAAGSAGDPWTTTLPGAYTGSQAGKILSDILVDTGTTLQGELDGIQADIAAEAVKTAAIKVKTDNLPSDPADASDIAAAFSTVNSTLTTIASYVDTEVSAIKTVTDKLNTTMVLDGAVYQFTVNALENGPSGSGGGGSATLANQELILDAIADLSGIQPTIISSFDPVTKAITLVRNDAYLDALGTAIEIPVNIPTGVDASTLDGARLGAKYKHGSTTLVGDVTLVEIASQWTARIEFAMAATAGKALGEYTYDVEITFDGQDITILSGSLRLVEDYSTH